MSASACFLNFFCNRAFWNARAPALLCKVSLRGMARKEAGRFAWCQAGGSLKPATPPDCRGSAQDLAQEQFGAGMLRGREELVGRVGFDDLARVHEHDAVGALAGKAHLVG